MIKLKRILVESDLQDVIRTTIKYKNNIPSIKNPDFDIIFDIKDDNTAELTWINNKTNKYKGRDIFEAFMLYLKSKGIKRVEAWGTKGKMHGTTAIGYYVMLKYGVIPTNINDINKILNTNYKNIQDAFKDPSFWENWKANGDDYFGVFDLSNNSLSWKVFKGQYK